MEIIAEKLNFYIQACTDVRFNILTAPMSGSMAGCAMLKK